MYKINKESLSPVVDFAAEELKKYLRMMMPRCGDIPIGYDKEDNSSFRLGLMQDFGISPDEALNPELDDVICIQTDEKGGIISGSNPRSVLLAVYRYLRENGCRWFFPGVDGEYIPIKDVNPVSYRKMADHRFRGQCNEGSEAQQNMLETIDFAPKVGLNVYMLEFDIPYYYYNVWYSHTGSTTKQPEPVSKETVLQWKRMCETEIAKRGLQFHDMGHGWTSESFGFDSSGGWADRFKDEIIPDREKQEFIAMKNGERKFHMNIPLNTNFCMSNPKARKLFANYVSDYAQKQNNVDFLHIWLADSSNNHCECDECTKKPTADWYVILLNELDMEFTRRNLNTRLVFIAYQDLLWAPVMESINNPDRYSLLFAPITRTYTESYGVDADMDSYTPYQRNKLKLPKGMSQNLACLKKWQEKYKGTSMAYEYHFHWVHYCDPGYMSIAKCVYDDIQGLRKNNIQGIIEDQTQRGFFPTAYPQYVYAMSLFDASLTLEEIEEDYFSHAFGTQWQKACDYLKEISHIFEFSYMVSNSPFGHYKGEMKNSYIAQNMMKVSELASDFDNIIKENINSSHRVQSVSWQLLSDFKEFVVLYADACRQRALGNLNEASEAFKALCSKMSPIEDKLQRYFDLGLFHTIMGTGFKGNTDIY